MSLTEFDEEAFIRQMKAEGRAEGRIEGANEARLESAVIAVKEFGISPEMVSAKYGVNLRILNEALEKN
ncbi:MAG: hypothetical protein KBT11_04360 [Treponema sp.]|nr:hypothetical protein [Candidatus Treponema equifaecale]